jgi:hypothetical protein
MNEPHINLISIPKRISPQSNYISQKEITPDQYYLLKGLTLELGPTSQNEIYEQTDFNLRERGYT